MSKQSIDLYSWSVLTCALTFDTQFNCSIEPTAVRKKKKKTRIAKSNFVEVLFCIRIIRGYRRPNVPNDGAVVVVMHNCDTAIKIDFGHKIAGEVWTRIDCGLGKCFQCEVVYSRSWR